MAHKNKEMHLAVGLEHDHRSIGLLSFSLNSYRNMLCMLGFSFFYVYDFRHRLSLIVSGLGEIIFSRTFILDRILIDHGQHSGTQWLVVDGHPTPCQQFVTTLVPNIRVS
jgi:hypothetical protein